jgi:uncharacterized protein (DUF1697 family)
MIASAESIPSESGSNVGEQTYVAYLFSDVDKPSLVEELPVERQFLSIFYAPGAIVWNIKRDNYNRSHITKIVGPSSYARMTTRNVNTARKLASLCAGGQMEVARATQQHRESSDSNRALGGGAA